MREDEEFSLNSNIDNKLIKWMKSKATPNINVWY